MFFKTLYFFINGIAKDSIKGLITTRKNTLNRRIKLLSKIDNLLNQIRVINKKTFFLPNYNQSKNIRIPDLRNQLYWNTDLKAAKTFSFFTSDVVGTFSINFHDAATAEADYPTASKSD